MWKTVILNGWLVNCEDKNEIQLLNKLISEKPHIVYISRVSVQLRL